MAKVTAHNVAANLRLQISTSGTPLQPHTQQIVYAGDATLAILHVTDETRQWIEETTPTAKAIECGAGLVVMFKEASDATLFKLTWGGV